MGYNSHPKIMKKLFYSFVMLVAMSLTFVACEQKNPDDNKQEIKSNCELFVCQYSIDETGHAMYVFEFSTNGLDIVNAKGSDDLAMRIKTLAKENDIEIVENKLLARELYTKVEIGDIIPEEYLQAMAIILAKVYTMKGKKL